jgi:undecaprenyl-diphosphatase
LDLLRALLLGIVQGLTEFLPVSSSGHLELAKVILSDDSIASESLLMTVTLHFATAVATIFVFRKDIAQILRGLFQFRANESTAFSAKILLSMLPAAFVGLTMEDMLDQLFDRQIALVGFMLFVTGLLLFLADRARNTGKRVSYSGALIIGLSQAIAILPGISRSGATISTSVLLGVDRERAARFSFLMVVPLILGKIAKDIIDGAFTQAAQPLSLLVGFVAALITGYFACTWMIRLVKNSQLKYFAYYCFAVGTLALIAWFWS